MLTQRQLFLQHVAQTSEAPMALDIVKAEGCTLTARDGKTYTDLISGISVSNTGHRHPAIVQAIKDQVDQYMYLMVYGEYVQSPQVELAHKIASLLPDPIDNVYFVNSGSEAIEGAMKLAKRTTGRSEIISFNQAYHGSTHGALSLMGDEHFRHSFRPLLPDCKKLTYNNIDDINEITTKTAAVFLEPIQGEAGIRPATQAFMKALSDRCRETETLLVVDEIQTGFGRTGKFFGFEHYGIVPDVVVMAKGLGGGMPIGAFAASQQLMAHFKTNPVLGHITTFGGHPVCCAAALANINVIESEDLVAQVDAKSQLFRSLLKHDLIQEIRHKGLMMAVQLSDRETFEKVVDRCIENGLIVDWFLFNDSSIRIAPPLIISEDEIRKSCAVLLEAMDFFS